jgi:hypothetical protein
VIQFDNTGQGLVTVLSMRINTPIRLRDWDARVAYAAAITEAEGYIAIARRRATSGRESYSLVLGVNMTDPEIPQLLSASWGGRVGCYRGFRNHRPLFCWRLTGERAVGFLKDVEPCLATDRARGKVRLAIAFQRQKEGRRPQGRTASYRDRQREFHRAMRLLNLRGASTLNAAERAVVIASALEEDRRL